MKIRRFSKHLHFVFQLFIFLAGLLGFWQQLCTLEITVFRGRSCFIGHLQDSCLSSGKVVLHPCRSWWTEFYRGHTEIQDRLHSPKGEEDSVPTGTFATSCPGTESQDLVDILKSRGGFHQLVHSIRSPSSMETWVQNIVTCTGVIINLFS